MTTSTESLFKPALRQTSPRWGLSLWGVFVVLPAVISTGARTSNSRAVISRILGADVAGYLAYAPGSLVAYVLGALVFAPLVLLLLALGFRKAPDNGERPALSRLRSVLATWTLLNAATTLLTLVTAALTGVLTTELIAWSWRITLLVVVSGLTSLSIASLATEIFQRPWLAILAGVVASAGLALWGIGQRDHSALCAGWSPGAVDECLFSGAPDSLWKGLLRATTWLLLGAVTAAWLNRGRATTARSDRQTARDR
jgi:hypothetical protein